MKRRCVIEKAIGENRAAVYEGKKCVELYVRRWSAEKDARTGDVFSGVIRHIDKSMGAAFVDLGLKIDGFLKFTMAPKAPRFYEGLRINVEVTREAEAGKGPVLKFRALSKLDKTGRISGDNLQDFIAKRFNNNITFEFAQVNTIESALEREISVPGGGDIAIDFTRALVAIDVDKGAAQSGFNVGKSVASLIANQLRLRGIGGLIIIDLPNVRQPRQRDELHKTMLTAFDNDPHIVKIAPMSRFGTVEMTRSKSGLSLDETINDRFGNPTIETQALRALRRLEAEGRANGGAILTLIVPSRVKSWLEAEQIGWKSALTERIGARFKLESGRTMDVGTDR